MTTVTVASSYLHFLVDAVEYNCQVYAYNLAPNAGAEGETINVGCPETDSVVIPPEGQPGVATLTVSLLYDWSDTGWSFVFSGMVGEVVDFTLDSDINQPTQARTRTGKLKIPAIADPYTIKTTQRGDVAFTVTEIADLTRYTAA